MGAIREYVCDNCGWEYIKENDIFMINKKHEVSVSPILFSTSEIIQYQAVTGSYDEFYCYNCGEIVKNFIINEIMEDMYGFDEEEIFKYIKDYDDSLKIIELGDEFQKCPQCADLIYLKPNSRNFFGLTENYDFENLAEFIVFHDIENIKAEYKLLGKLLTYSCIKCNKEINKFIILHNLANFNSNEIKEILNDFPVDLTMYLDETNRLCPVCENKLSSLADSSKCPKCGQGKLKLENFLLID